MPTRRAVLLQAKSRLLELGRQLKQRGLATVAPLRYGSAQGQQHPRRWRHGRWQRQVMRLQRQQPHMAALLRQPAWRAGRFRGPSSALWTLTTTTGSDSPSCCALPSSPALTAAKRSGRRTSRTSARPTPAATVRAQLSISFGPCLTTALMTASTAQTRSSWLWRGNWPSRWHLPPAAAIRPRRLPQPMQESAVQAAASERTSTHRMAWPCQTMTQRICCGLLGRRTSRPGSSWARARTTRA
mmetsp:Transcript_104753/g.325539  ORF Transcript_104753/g.325539 Transcript_104753/m.325539 type:complete len:242 (-) Transcript_104753:899-1624(-)